jgi:hypothetical protein
VFSVGDGVTNHVLKEHLQYTTGLLVDETGDSLDTTTTGKTTDGRLGDSLDVVTQNFAMTFGASLAESFSSFAATSHFLNEFQNEYKNKLNVECFHKGPFIYQSIRWEIHPHWLSLTATPTQVNKA